MATGQDLVDWMKARIGKFRYSQLGDRLHPDQTGTTDCSGLVAACYREVAGMLIGSWTGNEIAKGSQVFGTDEESVDHALQLLQPGDLVFFNWEGHNPSWDHVEMFAGNGQTIGHGGDPLYGPVLHDFRQEWGWASEIMARRYLSVPQVQAPAPAPEPAHTVAPPPPPAKPHLIMPYPFRGNDRFGLITGPSFLHGGYYQWEKPYVKGIQDKLLWLGLVPGLSYPNNDWADGVYEGPTADAVAAFQRHYMPGTQYYGEVWGDDYAKLESL